MPLGNETIYIKGEQNVEVQKKDVRLGDILSMECTNQSVLNHLKTIKLLQVHYKNS